MREILFRGKRIDNGEWVYGNFCMDALEQIRGLCGLDGFIRRFNLKTASIEMNEVDRETVGQYTGLTDKNGKRIFEGDVVKSDNGRSSCTWVVRYGEYIPTMFYELVECFYGNRPDLPSFGLYGDVIGSDSHVIITKSGRLEVIGNIHDDPELLKEG